MSPTARDAPGPFQPAITQRDVELEVAQCVGGVISPVLMNVALHGMEEAAGPAFRVIQVV